MLFDYVYGCGTIFELNTMLMERPMFYVLCTYYFSEHMVRVRGRVGNIFGAAAYHALSLLNTPADEHCQCTRRRFVIPAVVVVAVPGPVRWWWSARPEDYLFDHPRFLV